MKLNARKATTIIALAAIAIATSSCKHTKSYSELLDDEIDAVNWYLAQNRVETSVPADSVFEIGKDAPFYKMNSDGTIYMRVINAGDPDSRPEKGETVLIRFTRYNINHMYQGLTGAIGDGNTSDMSAFPNGISFIYGNNVLSSTTQYGTGIQMPLNYLGYNCEVDLIVKSVEGFTAEVTNCSPYVYKNLKYFKAEY